MTRSQIHASIALGCTLALAVVAAIIVPPVPSVSAAEHAERICRGNDIRPNSVGYEYCMSQAVQALDGGEPEMAYMLGRVAAAAREACQSSGLQPQSTAFQACFDRETQARRLLIFTDQNLDVGPQLAKP